MCVYFNILNEADCFGAIRGGVRPPPTPPFRQTYDDDLNDNIGKQAAIFICNIHICMWIYLDKQYHRLSAVFCLLMRKGIQAETMPPCDNKPHL